jgi:tetratricopeptide (TPR) repeat protein
MGCQTGGEKDFLRLSWEDFDQNPASGWRPLAEDGDYAGAARMIEDYLANRKDLLDAQRGYSRFHAGQLWALAGKTEQALELLDQATVTDMPPEFPQSFNALVSGTRGFLRGDMETVRESRDRVAAMPGLTARDSMFLEALELLSRSEGLTYLEVYAEAVK